MKFKSLWPTLRWLLLIALFAYWLALFTAPLFAAPAQCAPRDEVTGQLALTYSETPFGIGVVGPAAVMEIWISPDGATWSVLITRPDGVSCLIGAGTNFQHAVRAKDGDPT